LRFFDYLGISGYIARMDDSEVANPASSGRFSASWISDQFNLSGSYLFVDPEFDSDLGFIRRRDIKSQTYWAGWNPRPKFLGIRQFRFNGSVNYLTDIHGRLLTRVQNISYNTTFQSGDNFRTSYGWTFERLDDEFSPGEDIAFPPGDYRFQRWSGGFNTYSARKLSARINVSGGGYFSGTRYSISPGGTIRFNENFNISPSYSYNTVSDGLGHKFQTHIVSLRATLNFNERWLTNSLVQYNSVSSEMPVFLRLRYIYGNDDSLYVVYKQSRLWEGDFSGKSDRQLVVKITKSVDF